MSNFGIIQQAAPAQREAGITVSRLLLAESGHSEAVAGRVVTICLMHATDEQIRNAIEGLLDSRQPLATVCLSEAA